MNYLQMQFFMEQKGYSISDLSRITGIPQEILEKILSGEDRNVNYQYLFQLERALVQKEQCVREPEVVYGTRRKYTLDDYYALPEEKRVELIDGEFYDMASPSTAHQRMLREVLIKASQYIRDNQGGCEVFASPLDVQLDSDPYTMVQPDILIVCDPKKVIDRCVMGAPDFVLEILSPSTRKKDITIKLKKYQAAGVREYWMVDMEKEHVIVYFFEKSGYPVIYGIKDKVGVGIYDGKLEIDFGEILGEIREKKSDFI